MPPAPAPTSALSPPDDDIGRAQRGDMDAFERLYRAHVGRVNALCLRLTGGAGAEELLQDAFVRVWEKLPSFRGESAFASWVHRVTVNVFLHSRRGDRRREAWVMGAEDPDALELDPSRGFVSDDPDTRMDLERAMALLPPGARVAFVLHEIEGYRHDEIAEMQGIAAATVRAQLHRARKLLMEALDR
jgi:RNA polymerase sigma-70 factor (ECF subfamily)